MTEIHGAAAPQKDPAPAGADSAPPFWSWRALYAAVLVFLALLIGLLALFQQAFA